MKALEEKIKAEGKVYPGNVLKVGGFLNHRIDVDFVMEMGREIARLFEGCGVNKILTIESSGIAVAFAAASFMHVPLVFAKKGRTGNMSPDVYGAMVHSYTHNIDSYVVVSREYLDASDKVLVVDDFLALGNAVNGLIDIVNEAGAEVVGVAAAIEKGFQGGGDALRSRGIRVESLAIVESMEDGKIKFRPQD